MGCRRRVAKIAEQSLVIDASVGVKWFSRKNEPDLAQADLLLDSRKDGVVSIWVPDLFFYEVANALATKGYLSGRDVHRSVESLWNLGLRVVPVDGEFLARSAALARQLRITVYDACYAAVASKVHLPLVTANPRHQGRAFGCPVISLRDWRGP
ncbi:MAG: type II toxin-antitoxin system VapC family toxin [Chloroflexi bacterium]|nr:type II toxin-antitoxin system VapC family toxin [Chloroflexota bacterium]